MCFRFTYPPQAANLNNQAIAMELRILISKLSTMAAAAAEKIGCRNALRWLSRAERHGLRLVKLGFIPPTDAPYETQLYFPSLLHNNGTAPVTILRFQLDFGAAFSGRLRQQQNDGGRLFQCVHSTPSNGTNLGASKGAPLTIIPNKRPVPVNLTCTVHYHKRNDGTLRESLIAHVRNGRFKVVLCIQGGRRLAFSGKGVEIG